MPDGSRIVLFGWGASAATRLRNVERIAQGGEVLWQAELPSSDRSDCFVSLQRTGDIVTVETFSGTAYQICLETGAKV